MHTFVFGKISHQHHIRVNPSNAKATFVQNTRMQRKASVSVFLFLDFWHHFVNIDKLATSSIGKVNPSDDKATLTQCTRMHRFFEKPSKPCHIGIHYMVLASRSAGCLFGHPNP